MSLLVTELLLSGAIGLIVVGLVTYVVTNAIEDEKKREQPK